MATTRVRAIWWDRKIVWKFPSAWIARIWESGEINGGDDDDESRPRTTGSERWWRVVNFAVVRSKLMIRSLNELVPISIEAKRLEDWRSVAIVIFLASGNLGFLGFRVLGI